MIDILIDRIIELNSPIVVGLDPREYLIPDFLLTKNYNEYGHTKKALAHSFLEFNKEIIDSIYDIVPAIKPQIAFYEELGLEGLKAYIETIEYAKEKGLLIIGDVKRSDIASSAIAYANGHLGEVDIKGEKYSSWHEDFITINPYLGKDSLEPFLDISKEYNKAVFALVKTSNPGSGDIQNLVADGKAIYHHVGEMLEALGKDNRGKYGFSQIGAVVGATHSKEAKELREIMPHTFFLVPGYGAQGATAKDLSVCFNQNGLGAIINSSRGIIGAYREESFTKGDKYFGEGAREASLAMIDDINKYIIYRK